ncbi:MULTISPECIES: tape measure protein [Burkholderia cepacia complex]|uniref:tape measure protein n=1 Tax=Burkholderia cepacia complex TaxID=87882 RepID=UPI000CFF4A32|nr:MULTISPECIES: tape measure protein [Burkholderia cepacia complex]PRE26219.1 tape measure domain-containing protein [Burkholderia multivorans]PRF94822.1 tape measure domain-containing protein [Burkholderia multivorans]
MANNRAQILITAVDETRRAFQSVQGSLSRLRSEAGQVGEVLSRIGGAIGVGLGVRELVEVADQYKNLQARLRLAVTSQEEFNRADAALFEIAQRNRAPLAETVTLYARLAPSVQALGRSQADVLAATDAIGQAVSLSGASSEAAAGALLQLGQAFASGQLRGEEFNSVIEQTPRLAQAIADGMGVPLGSLRALAQEGKITSKAVLDALLKQRGRLAEEYGSLPDTVSGALTRLKNAFLRAFGERDTSSGLTAGLAQAIQLVAQHLELLIDLAGVVLVAAFGRMVSAFATSIAAARAEAAARLANLRTLEAEALARVRLADAALAQARAQGLATSALVVDAAKARLQATAATGTVTQAVASTSLLGRAAGLLRGVLALLGGPIGVIVTTVTLLAGALYSARNALVEFGGKTASIKQIVSATWDLVVEKVGDVVSALGRLVGANNLSWARVREVMLNAIRAIGSAIRTMVNGVIGAFNAVGSVVGVTAAFMVERFRNAFSDIGELAKALGQDVAAAFSGDFSMQSLRAVLGRRLGEMRDFGKQLAGTVRDAVTRDYVGEAAQAIAGRIRPDKNQPGVFGRPQPPAKPTPDKGVEAAKLALVQAQAEAELKILKDALDRQARELDAALEGRLISLKDYYAAKTRIEQQEIDAEIQRAQVSLAQQQSLVKTGKDEPTRIKAKVEVAKLEAELTVLNNKRADVEVANARKAVQAERELREELAKVRDELLDLTGAATSQDRRAAIERQYQSLIERLRAEGDTEGVATVGRLIDVKAAAADLAEYERQFNDALARMRASEESINLQRQSGLLTESQARQQILALHQQTGQSLDALLPQLEATATAIGPDAVARVQAWKNEIAQVKLVVDDVAVAIDGAVQDGFAQLFQDIGSGAKSAKEAFADFGRSVLQTINRIASQKLAEALFGSLMGGGSAGGASGLGGLIASFFSSGFATGGYVTGPGTSTSDSIPARLSHGEYVVNARAVSRLGVSFLNAINGLSAGPRFSGGRLAFAAGGLVPEAPAQPAPSQNIRIVNVIDPAMAADYLNSSAGERVVMNLIQRNAASVRNILGR